MVDRKYVLVLFSELKDRSAVAEETGMVRSILSSYLPEKKN
jgi:hypothetical protein